MMNDTVNEPTQIVCLQLRGEVGPREPFQNYLRSDLDS
jgi:hypothetical protein